jgi:hypothetical protein
MPDPNPVPQTQPSPQPTNDRPLSDAFAPIGADQSLDINQGLEALLGRLATGDPSKEAPPDRIAEANERAIRALQRETVPAERPAQQGVEEPGEEPKEDQPPPSDDTFLEWTGEDGKPQRVPLAEAVQALQHNAQLTNQYQQLQQQNAQMPEQLERAIMGAAQTRGMLLQEIDRLKGIYMPQQPPRTLLDKTNPQYDPERYASMLADFDRGRQWLAHVEQSKRQQLQNLEREQSALHEATIARGRAQLMQGMPTSDGQEGWPELFSDPKEQTSLGDLLRWAGYDPNSALDTVLDPRAYLIMKLAREGLTARRAKRAPPRPVRSAPRLVRGAGRVQPGADETSADMTKLAQTGRYQDAEEIVMRILQKGT